MVKDENITIRCEADFKKKLEETAKKSRRTPTAYVRLLIEDAIKNQTKL